MLPADTEPDPLETHMTTHHRTCSLCDAMCRLRLKVEDGTVTRIAGEPDDPWSMGHVCPKAVALKDLYEDPDRLRTPMRRTPAGWQPISWDEALDETATRLAATRREHGRDAVGVYVGNPNAHHYANLFAVIPLLGQLDTRARFTAVSVDNLPHLFAAYHMFGHNLLFGVSDVDRAEHMLIVGANPWVSNGGGMSSGHVRKRIGAIQARGGKVVVVDPRLTETARHADAHHFLQPGSDALLFLAMLQVLFAEDRIDDGSWRSWCDGLDRIESIAMGFPPERVAAATGLGPEIIRTLAREFSDAPAATIYARIGICTQRYAGLAAWLHVVLHAVTGNLDRPGGLMFARPAVDTVALTALLGIDGNHTPGATRGTGLPGFTDELPLAAMAEEIETPGPGQIRALITLAGNPALSAPNGERLGAALDTLDFHVAVDMYLNETSSRAHLVLPAASPLERDHYPLGLASISTRTIAEHSQRLFDPDGARDDFDILTDLGLRLARAEGSWMWRAVYSGARAAGARRVLDLLLRTGPHGSLRGGPLNLAMLDASPVTIDLGPMQPCMPERMRTPHKRARLAPECMQDDIARLVRDLEAGAFAEPLVLIGRRTLRSNNSWMHNSERLVKGKPRCTLLMHPDDARSAQLSDGDMVRIRSRVGQVEAPLEITDTIKAGVVSLPHGWGHGRPGTRMRVANAHPGVSANVLTDDALADPLTGTATFNGVPVVVEALTQRAHPSSRPASPG